VLATFVAAAILAGVHLVAGYMHFLDAKPRSRWLSAAGGTSVAYVFVHLLPDLSAAQDAVSEAAEGVLGYVESHVYLIALLGLAVFYGLESAALQRSPARPEEAGRSGGGDHADPERERAVMAVSVGAFALYNAVIGYVLTLSEDLRQLAFFTVAIGVHFIVNDHGLREEHRGPYERWGRWVLVAAVLAGWAVGVVVELPEHAAAIPLAFVAGAIILTVLKEELPEERQSRFGAFALGAGLYTALLLLL
jgi:hypothetical protein